MRNEIEKAIKETLVIENKQSIYIAVDKVQKILLEALEREVINSYVQSEIDNIRYNYGRSLTDGEMASTLIEAKNYYETEVKPKYE